MHDDSRGRVLKLAQLTCAGHTVAAAQMPDKADDVSSLPLFAMEEAEAWLMSDDTVETLFNDLWLYPSATVVDEQPESEQRLVRRCKAHSTTVSPLPPIVCGKQVKVWFENKRCSDKRTMLGIKARRPKN